MNEITLNRNDLYNLLKQAAKDGANEVLKEQNLIKTTISRSEVIKLYGHAVYNQSLHFVKWQKKAGKTSKVYCNKSEFENFLNRFNEQKPVYENR